jgi:hypothetical protein
MKTYGGAVVKTYLFLNSAMEWGEWSTLTPRLLYTPKKELPVPTEYEAQ